MDKIELKTSTSIRIDSGLLKQIKREAKAENRSLSNYIETVFYRLGYRPYNEDTTKACQEAQEGVYEGVVDTTNLETIEASLFDEEA